MLQKLSVRNYREFFLCKNVFIGKLIKYFV